MNQKQCLTLAFAIIMAGGAAGGNSFYQAIGGLGFLTTALIKD
jgi:hypothetical protein